MTSITCRPDFIDRAAAPSVYLCVALQSSPITSLLRNHTINGIVSTLHHVPCFSCLGIKYIASSHRCIWWSVKMQGYGVFCRMWIGDLVKTQLGVWLARDWYEGMRGRTLSAI